MRLSLTTWLLLLLVLLLASAALGLWGLQHWLASRQLALTGFEGLSLSRHGVRLERLELNHRQCRQVAIEQLQLGYRKAEWQLHAARLHGSDHCPPPPQPTAPALPSLPRWLPPLNLSIDRLQLDDQPVIAVSGLYQPAQQRWQLQLRRGETDRLSVNGSTTDPQCRIEAEAPRLRLALDGRCHLQQGIALAGLAELAQISVPVRLDGNWPELTLRWGPIPTAQGDLGGDAWLDLRQRLFRLQARWQQGNAAWQLRSKGQADLQGRLSGTLQLDRAAPRAISQHLNAQWGGTLSQPQLQIASASRLTLPLPGMEPIRLRPTTPWILSYHQQQLALTGAGRWRTAGSMPGGSSPASGTLSAQVQLRPADLSLGGSLKISAEHRLADSGQAGLATTLTLDGSLPEPRLTVPAGSRLVVSRPRWQGWQAEQLSLHLRRAVTVGRAGLIQPLWLQLDASQPRWRGRPLPPLSARLILSPPGTRWHLAGRLGIDNGEIEINGRFDPRRADLQFSTQALPLARLLTAQVEQLQLVDGQLDGQANLSWRRDRGLLWRAEGWVDNVSAVHPQGLVAGANLSFTASAQPAQLTIAGRFNATEVNPGLLLRQPRGSYHWRNTKAGSRLLLGNVSVGVLDGTLTARSLKFPSGTLADRVTLTGVALEEIVKLQQRSAVALSGRVDATLPLRLTPAGIEIHAGRITNSGPLQLALLPTPAVERWLGSQPQLSRVGEYLRQLQIDRLTAQVDLASDGELVLDSRILGHNPSLGQRPVQLNYHHEENLLDLLTSLRMSDHFTQEIEQRLQRWSTGENRP